MNEELAAGPADRGSALCLSCGLCCTGALYPSVALWPDELERAERFGLPVYSDGRTRRFRLPCPKHVASVCTVYAERPRVCAGFRCISLDEYLAGTIDLAVGEARTEAIKALMTSVEPRLPPEVAGEGPAWERVRGFLEKMSPDDAEAWRRGHGELLRDVAALVGLCREHLDARLGNAAEP